MSAAGTSILQVGIPLPIFSGALGYQVTAWAMGKRVYYRFNHDALAFGFCVVVLALFWWLAQKLDARSDDHPYLLRTMWWTAVIGGGLFGAVLRAQGILAR